MIWKLLNKIFGWDYVAWKNTCDQGIARVHVDGRGHPFYWRYKVPSVVDQITDADQVMWLTCAPGKYLSLAKERK